MGLAAVSQPGEAAQLAISVTTLKPDMMSETPMQVVMLDLTVQSFYRILKLLGIKKLHNKKAIRNTTEAAQKASKWVWIKMGICGQATWTQARA